LSGFFFFFKKINKWLFQFTLNLRQNKPFKVRLFWKRIPSNFHATVAPFQCSSCICMFTFKRHLFDNIDVVKRLSSHYIYHVIASSQVSSRSVYFHAPKNKDDRISFVTNTSCINNSIRLLIELHIFLFRFL
jgi:hypothetical protein